MQREDGHFWSLLTGDRVGFATEVQQMAEGQAAAGHGAERTWHKCPRNGQGTTPGCTPQS